MTLPKICPIPQQASRLWRDILALNAQEEIATSALEEDKLHVMLHASFAALYIEGSQDLDQIQGFLLAFDQSAAYDSPNFLWFQQRLDRFIYIDRVVISPLHHGKGFARALYLALFDVSVLASHETVVCEVNIEPPNPVSDAFHQSLHFKEIGRATLAQSGKTIRYLQHQIDPRAHLARMPNTSAS